MNAKDRLDQEVKKSGLSFKEWYWKIYLSSDHWQDLRKRKLKEAGYKCSCCRKKKRLDIHHKNYRNIFDVQLSDLLACCRKCHIGIEKYIAKMKKRVYEHRKNIKNRIRRWTN